MAFVLSTVMDDLATATGVTRAFAYDVPQITPPCVLVRPPTRLDFDYTFHANGTDGTVSATFPVWYVVADVLDKAARDALSALITGAGSIKRTLDGAVASAQISNTSNAQIDKITIGGVDYWGVRFDVEIVA